VWLAGGVKDEMIAREIEQIGGKWWREGSCFAATAVMVRISGPYVAHGVTADQRRERGEYLMVPCGHHSGQTVFYRRCLSVTAQRSQTKTRRFTRNDEAARKRDHVFRFSLTK
jgi:hypothetical protein